MLMGMGSVAEDRAAMARNDRERRKEQEEEEGKEAEMNRTRTTTEGPRTAGEQGQRTRRGAFWGKGPDRDQDQKKGLGGGTRKVGSGMSRTDER